MWIYVFISLGQIPNNEIAGSCGNSMFILLRNYHTVFWKITPFYIPISYVWEFQSLYIFTNTCFYIFLILAPLVGMKWYLTMVLIWISLVANHVEFHFMCFLAIGISFLKKCLFRSFALCASYFNLKNSIKYFKV